MWYNFLIALQFLTRINITNKDIWTQERFNNSIKYFPLVGFIVGCILSLIYLIGSFFIPPLALCAILIVAEIAISGGLHCDGLMDTADGIFSGRPRERMLEIMRDSCIGANAAMAFISIVLLKFSFLLSINPELIPLVLCSMQILSKLSLVLAVDLPYARKDGLGKINIDDKTVTIAFLIVGFFCGIFQLVFSFSLLAVVLSTVFISRKIIKQLGGLTGDTYGAIHEINSIVVLFVYLFF